MYFDEATSSKLTPKKAASELRSTDNSLRHGHDTDSLTPPPPPPKKRKTKVRCNKFASLVDI